MDIPVLKDKAAALVRQAGQAPFRLVLLHSGVVAAASVLLTGISWLLAQVAPAGGIGNLDTHIALMTLQAVLYLAVLLLLPFWRAGLVHGFSELCRGQQPSLSSMTAGLRNYRPLLSSLAFRTALYALPVLPCGYFCYSMAASAGEFRSLYPEVPGEMLNAILISYGVFYAIALTPLLLMMLYRYRMSDWLIMENPERTGMESLRMSLTLSKGNKRRLLRLDLSYWWYYVAEGCLLAMSLAGLLPERFGSVRWILPLAAALLRLVLQLCCKSKMMTVYALFYQQAPQMEPPQAKAPKTPQAPGKVPWKY